MIGRASGVQERYIALLELKAEGLQKVQSDLTQVLPSPLGPPAGEVFEGPGDLTVSGTRTHSGQAFTVIFRIANKTNRDEL